MVELQTTLGSTTPNAITFAVVYFDLCLSSERGIQYSMPNADQSVRWVVLGIGTRGSRGVPYHPLGNARSASLQATWPPHAVRAGTLAVLFALHALLVPKRSLSAFRHCMTSRSRHKLFIPRTSVTGRTHILEFFVFWGEGGARRVECMSSSDIENSQKMRWGM